MSIVVSFLSRKKNFGQKTDDARSYEQGES